MRLIVICSTVLALMGMRECGKIQRQAMQSEDRYKVWLRAEYMRQHPIERPSLEIVPKRNDFGFQMPESGKGTRL
jgi:hypothetical protein